MYNNEEADLTEEIIKQGDGPVDRSFAVIMPTATGLVVQKHDPKFVISGDTDSSYVDLSSKFQPSADRNEVIAFADNLAKQVNESFSPWLMSVFNTTPEQAHAIQTEREMVSDKSYFIVKKNYIMHYINKEGVDKDDYKIMGLAIKRTDTPKVVKDFLTKMLNMIMDHKTYHEINAAILEFKEQYKKCSFLDVGRPMTIKELTKFEKKYNEAVAAGASDPMKGFAYHARASLYYNFMCGPSDIKIYSGNKIKVVYIDHPEIKYIAVPADADVLPKFLDDIKIDWDAQWEKVVKKINLYLVPIDLCYEE